MSSVLISVLSPRDLSDLSVSAVNIPFKKYSPRRRGERRGGAENFKLGHHPKNEGAKALTKGVRKMKTYIALIVAAVFLSACGQNQPASNTNTQPAAGSPSRSSQTGSQPAQPQTTTGAPVEFIYGGITPDKTSVSYKIKVNTDKPIDEVHLALKEMDGKGKVIGDTTIIWQNIVGSTRRPIEQGKTYEDQSALDPAAVKADVSLKEVIFKDGTRWTAH